MKDMSKDFEFPPLEVEHIKCTVENVVDREWLFNNIPWMNHSNKTAFLTLDKVSTIFYYDREVKSIEFNEVGASAMHGFGGNLYAFTFQLDGEKVHSYSAEPEHMSLAKDEVVQKVWDSCMWKLRRNSEQREEILEEIKNLHK